jgi:uncharacterized protein (TIGR03083 family)
LPAGNYIYGMKIPIQTLHLFPKLDENLIEVLRELTPEEWFKPTLARQWCVKDIAAHLLDGNIRTVAMLRDRHFGENPGDINTYQDLVNYLNRLNADWVAAMKRVSPTVLIELLELTGKSYYEALASLDPFKPSLFSVAWAGQHESPNWFHIAREYTEKWHHQQQIREAVNKPGIMSREFFFPLVDTFMQALPHTYRNTNAAENTGITVTVSGETGGSWHLVRTADQWQFAEPAINPQTEIILDPDTAWKLFTKGITAAEAKQNIRVTGNSTLAEPIFSMLAVMA